MMSDRLCLIIKAILLGVTVSLVLANVAIGCDGDPLVQRWVDEHDRAALHMLQGWAAGVPMDDLAEDAAVIIGNTVYIQARCKDDVAFLRTLLLFDLGPNPRIEMLPAVILEKQIRRPDFFSTDNISSKGGE